MEPGGASQIGPVPLHVVPCNPLAMPPPASSLPSNPAHPIPSQHPVPSHGRQSVAKCCRKGQEGEKKKRGDPCPWATPLLPARILWQSVLPLGRVHILLPLHSIHGTKVPTKRRLGNSSSSRRPHVPVLYIPWYPGSVDVLAVFGCNAKVHCENHLNVCQCIDQSGDRPVNFGTYCVSSEPLRADFLISRSRRLCLIVNLEPGPFEVHG